jgi:hypothetical protein
VNTLRIITLGIVMLLINAQSQQYIAVGDQGKAQYEMVKLSGDTITFYEMLFGNEIGIRQQWIQKETCDKASQEGCEYVNIAAQGMGDTLAGITQKYQGDTLELTRSSKIFSSEVYSFRLVPYNTDFPKGYKIFQYKDYKGRNFSQRKENKKRKTVSEAELKFTDKGLELVEKYYGKISFQYRAVFVEDTPQGILIQFTEKQNTPIKLEYEGNFALWSIFQENNADHIVIGMFPPAKSKEEALKNILDKKRTFWSYINSESK